MFYGNVTYQCLKFVELEYYNVPRMTQSLTLQGNCLACCVRQPTGLSQFIAHEATNLDERLHPLKNGGHASKSDLSPTPF